MSLLNRKTYEARWEKVSSRNLMQEELEAFTRAYVKESQFDKLSVCFVMRSGKCLYIDADIDAPFQAGDELDLTKVKVVTLSKPGRDDIERISI